jgi:hypothetical protein
VEHHLEGLQEEHRREKVTPRERKKGLVKEEEEE